MSTLCTTSWNYASALNRIAELASIDNHDYKARRGRLKYPNRRDADGSFLAMADDGAFALLDYGDGLVARITADATLSVIQASVAVHGERRSAVASGENLVVQRLFTIDDDEPSELETNPCAVRKICRGAREHPAFLERLDAYAERLDGKDTQIPTFENGLTTQRVLAAIGYGI